MRLAAIIAAVASLALLPACTEETEPSPMPTSEDALTTATEEPEDVAATSEPEETTEEPATEEPDAEGSTEMTAAGAEAAVAAYVSALSAVNLGDEDPDVLESLATENCDTCTGFAGLAANSPSGDEFLRLISSDALVAGDLARVETEVEQIEGNERANMVFELTWGDSQWLVDGIFVQQ